MLLTMKQWIISLLSSDSSSSNSSISSKSPLESLAQLPLLLVLSLLPGRDLARLACTSWTLFNRTLNDAVWHALFDDYLITMPFVLVYADSLPTYRHRMLRSRKLLSLRRALAEALDGDVVRVPMGVFETDAPAVPIRTRILLQGTRLECVRGRWQVYHRRHSPHLTRHFRDSATFLSGWQRDDDDDDDDHAHVLDRNDSSSTTTTTNARFVSSSDDVASTTSSSSLPRAPTADELSLLRSLPAWTPSSSFSPISFIDTRSLATADGPDALNELDAFDDERVRRMARVVINEIFGPLADFVTNTMQLDSAALVACRRAVKTELTALLARVNEQVRMLAPPSLPVLQTIAANANRHEDILCDALTRSFVELDRAVTALELAVKRACVAHGVNEPALTHTPTYSRRLHGRRRWGNHLRVLTQANSADVDNAASAAPSANAGQLFDDRLDGDAMSFLNGATRGPTRLYSMMVGACSVQDGVGFAAIDMHFEPRAQPSITSDGSGSLEVTNCLFEGRRYRATTAIRATAPDVAPTRKFVRISNCSVTMVAHGLVLLGASSTALVQDCVLTRCSTRSLLTDGECRLTIQRCLLTRCSRGIDAQGVHATPSSRARFDAASARSAVRQLLLPPTANGAVAAGDARLPDADVQRFAADLWAPSPRVRTNLVVRECVIEGCHLYGLYVRRTKALLSRCAIRGGEFGVLAFTAEVEVANSDLCEQKCAVVVLDAAALRAKSSCFRGATVGAALQGLSASTLALRECLVVGAAAMTLASSFASAQRCVLAALAGVPNASNAMPPVMRVRGTSVAAVDGGSVLRASGASAQIVDRQDTSHVSVNLASVRL